MNSCSFSCCRFESGSASERLPCRCSVPWFKYRNISDWLLKPTADDLMETLPSSALKNWRMIYNEMQPRSFFLFCFFCFKVGGCEVWVVHWTRGHKWGFLKKFFMLIKLLTFMLLSNQKQLLHPVMSSNRVHLMQTWKRKRDVRP